MLYLDYLSYNNSLKHVSIAEKLLLGGGGLALALTLPRPVTLFSVILVMHAVMLYARIPPAYLIRLWSAPLLFLLAGVAGIVVSVDASPFTALISTKVGSYFIGVTPDGLAAAQLLCLRSLAAVSCLFMLATTTPAAYITTYLARFPVLSGIGEIAMLTYRFIFVFLASAAQIYTAQQSRLGYAGPRRSLNSLALLAANIGSKTFLAARDLYIALQARNYRDQLSFYYPRQQISYWRLAVIVVTLSGIALTTYL